MRKFAWLTLVAAAALFFSAPESAFAHGAHYHTQQTQASPAPNVDLAVPAVEQAVHIGHFVSSAEMKPEKCPHGQGADCGFCCACAGGISAAVLTPAAFDRETGTREVRVPLALPFSVLQAVVDLSRPPKFFA